MNGKREFQEYAKKKYRKGTVLMRTKMERSGVCEPVGAWRGSPFSSTQTGIFYTSSVTSGTSCCWSSEKRKRRLFILQLSLFLICKSPSLKKGWLVEYITIIIGILHPRKLSREHQEIIVSKLSQNLSHFPVQYFSTIFIFMKELPPLADICLSESWGTSEEHENQQLRVSLGCLDVRFRKVSELFMFIKIDMYYLQ